MKPDQDRAPKDNRAESAPAKGEVDQLWRALGVTEFLVMPTMQSQPVVPAGEQHEFQSLLGKIVDLGWPVREFSFQSPRTVVIFADTHDMVLARTTCARLGELQKLVGFDVLGFEGLFEDPRSDFNARLLKRVDQILDIRNPARGPEQDARLSTGAQAWNVYADFIQSQSFNFIGLETERFDRAIINTVVASMAQMVREICHQVLKQPIVIAYDDQPIGHARNFLLGHSFLRTNGMELPEFPLRSFEMRSREGVTRRVAKMEDMPVLAALLSEYTLWLEQHCVAERNAAAALKMEHALSASKSNIAAMVFGLGHTLEIIDGRAAPGETIQTHLRKRNLSYILVDPIRDWKR